MSQEPKNVQMTKFNLVGQGTVEIRPPESERIIESYDTSLRYLEAQFRRESGFPSYIAPAGDFNKRVPAPTEIFSSLIISQCLVDIGIKPIFLKNIPRLISKVTNSEGFIHFFFDRELLVADVDCTAVAYSLLISLGQKPPFLKRTIDRIVNNTNDYGIIEVYQEPGEEHAGRVDECVLVNALHLLYSVGRASEALPSEQLVSQTLKERKYLKGTRYYPSPDAFLYFLSRLVRDFVEPRRRYFADLISALYERLDERGAYMDLALRYAALDNIGFGDPKYSERILEHRTQRGNWMADSFFKYGRTSLYFGGEPLSTGLGIRASIQRTSKATLR